MAPTRQIRTVRGSIRRCVISTCWPCAQRDNRPAISDAVRYRHGVMTWPPSTIGRVRSKKLWPSINSRMRCCPRDSLRPKLASGAFSGSLVSRPESLQIITAPDHVLPACANTCQQIEGVRGACACWRHVVLRQSLQSSRKRAWLTRCEAGLPAQLSASRCSTALGDQHGRCSVFPISRESQQTSFSRRIEQQAVKSGRPPGHNAIVHQL